MGRGGLPQSREVPAPVGVGHQDQGRRGVGPAGFAPEPAEGGHPAAPQERQAREAQAQDRADGIGRPVQDRRVPPRDEDLMDLVRHAVEGGQGEDRQVAPVGGNGPPGPARGHFRGQRQGRELRGVGEPVQGVAQGHRQGAPAAEPEGVEGQGQGKEPDPGAPHGSILAELSDPPGLTELDGHRTDPEAGQVVLRNYADPKFRLSPVIREEPKFPFFHPLHPVHPVHPRSRRAVARMGRRLRVVCAPPHLIVGPAGSGMNRMDRMQGRRTDHGLTPAVTAGCGPGNGAASGPRHPCFRAMTMASPR